MSTKVLLRARNFEVLKDLVKPLILSRDFSVSDRFCLYADRRVVRTFPRFRPSVCYWSSIGGDDGKKNLTLFQRFKLMYKEYWYVLLPVHVATSACWLGGFYYMAVSGMDISALLEVAGAPDSWVSTMRESKAGGIVTAYTLYKIATPARYTVTLGATTVSINYLKKWGLIKPMPSRRELQVMYEDKKTAFKEKMSATTDEIKDEFAKTTKEISEHVKEAKTGFAQSVDETRQGLKDGVREAADEWRQVGKLIKRNVKGIIKDEKK